ncbi:hypothetical protein J2W30_003641 [Variovorax boronicumulans]|uniref:hypothetical protein n=1 Tax=Variovorax boronicumulans TaxID=436515 RepID=UPI00277E8E03|nr:hypothetical protein [Variovorax boronicumulans]MDQ0035873.1 hypothetical protein [Variovorax boronicumulans]
MSAQHTPGPWVSHVVSIRLADGSKVITTEKGRTQTEANQRALHYREGACVDADDGCDSFHCEELGCTGACHEVDEEASSSLPDGANCGDCRHIRRCKAMFGHTETDAYCDWTPSRFAAIAKATGSAS